MKVNTHISNIMEGTAEKIQYDTEVKKVFSDKTILAWIMKYTVAEVLSETLTVQEKKKQLHDDYGIATSMELEGGLNQMCNLSDLIEERGIQKGKTEGRMEGRIEGRIEGLIEGQMEGLKALIAILKPLISNEEQLYQTVIQQEVYKDIPKETILKYFRV